MSLGRQIDHWGTNPGDVIDAALKAIESAVQELLATDPAYWRTDRRRTCWSGWRSSRPSKPR